MSDMCLKICFCFWIWSIALSYWTAYLELDLIILHISIGYNLLTREILVYDRIELGRGTLDIYRGEWLKADGESAAGSGSAP